MKKRRLTEMEKAVLVTLVLLGALFGLPGCAKKEAAPPPSCRFEGEAFPMPSDIMSVYSRAEPVYDGGSGLLTCIVFRVDSVELPEGGYEPHNRFSLVTASRDGVRSDVEIPVGEDRSIVNGVIREDAVYMLLTEIRREAETDPNRQRGYFLARYDRGTGEFAVSEDIVRFFDSADQSFYTEEFSMDEAGNYYVSGRHEVVVFSPDFVRKTSLSDGEYVRLLGPSPDGDGTMLAFEDVFVKNKFVRVSLTIDPDAGTMTERFRFETAEGMGNTRLGPDGALYIGSAAGIYRVAQPQDGGKAAPELVMDYAASDVIPESASLASVPEEGCFLTVERNMEGDRWVYAPVLYTRAEKADLTGVTVLMLAYDRADASLTSKIVAFNKAHRDIRVVTSDYAQYNTADDPSAGAARLALDIASGVLKPDIVASSPDSETVRQLYEKALYADLAPYIAADDLVNPNNLFGAVRHAFDDGRGGIWGLSTGFSLVTLASTRALLPAERAEQGCWTLSEMTDFAASLPAGVDFAELPCREYFMAFFTESDGLGEFVDAEAGVCTFDGPEFRRFLDALVSFPPMDELLPGLDAADGEPYLSYIEGRAALRPFYLETPSQVLGLEALFNRDDYVLIGLPTPVRRAGAGIRADMNDAVVLTSLCAHPDEAWKMIRFLFEGDVRMTVSVGGAVHDPIPSLRSRLDTVIDAYTAGKMEFRFYFDGTFEMKRGDPENPTDPAALDRPGIVSFFTEEKRDELYAILDSAGTPLAAKTDGKIREIVSEELSALFAGSCTAGECASRIQSRASIRLAEHKS